MTQLASYKPFLSLVFLLPAISVLFSVLCTRGRIWVDCIMVVFSLATFACVCWLFYHSTAGGIVGPVLLFYVLPERSISFAMDGPSILLALMSSFLWLCTSLYAISYFKHDHILKRRMFNIFMSLSILITLAAIFSANILTMFVCYELLTFSTYPLVNYYNSKESSRSGLIYLVTLLVPSLIFFMPAVVFVSWYDSFDSFRAGGVLSGLESKELLAWVLLMFFYGSAKAALFPLSFWLPAAMVAPTPVSAFLHAVAVVKVGVFVLFRVVYYVLGADLLREVVYTTYWGNVFVLLSGFSALCAGAIAIRQTHVKKILAYSTISQLSYIIMVIAMFSTEAAYASVVHIVSHAMGKITLFFAAGSIYSMTHKIDLRDWVGIGRVMPITCVCFVVGALSIIGILPLMGGYSKFYIIKSAYKSGSMAVPLVIAAGSMLSVFYLYPVMSAMFFEKPTSGKRLRKEINEAPLFMLCANIATALLSLLMPFMAIWHFSIG